MHAMSATSTPSLFNPGHRVAVMLPLPLGGAYDYAVGFEPLHPGDFVEVPLGNRLVTGVVWGAGDGKVEMAKLRPVARRLAASPLPEVTRRFVDWVAAYTLAPPGAVLKMAMSVPSALEPAAPHLALRLAAAMPEFKETPARRKVVEAAGRLPPLSAADLAREAGVGPAVVKGLAEAGVLETVELPPPRTFSPPDLAQQRAELSPAQHIDLKSKRMILFDPGTFFTGPLIMPYFDWSWDTVIPCKVPLLNSDMHRI